jgi:hypothetical protein
MGVYTGRRERELPERKEPGFGDFGIYERSTGMEVHQFLRLKVDRSNDKEGLELVY